MLNFLYRFLLPYTCILCHDNSDREGDLCQLCLDDLPILTQSCLQCATPLFESNLRCGECLATPPAFDRSFALFEYINPIPLFIRGLKFNAQLVYAKILGELLATKIKTDWYATTPLPSRIIPVPLHVSRLKARGFNQALEIARPIGKALSIPIDKYSCKRIKATAAQATLPLDKRIVNMRGAFYSEPLYGEHIAIVDDVMTTGQTLDAFCKMLKEAGAGQIDVWCCAKTPKKKAL